MLEYQDKHLHFAGQDVLKLVKDMGSPFFLFSQPDLVRRFKDFRKYFSSNYSKLRIDYSAKTNCEVGILKVLQGLGSHLEIASGQELYLAKQAGFEAEKVVFDNPCKTDNDIVYAIDEGIHAFYADSETDLQNILRVAKGKDQRVKFALRVSLDPKGFLAGLADKAIVKFGVPPEEIVRLAQKYHREPNLNFIGLSVHIGSQNLSPKPYLRTIDELTALVEELVNEGLSVEEINLGGGYPSQTLSKVTTTDLFLLPLGVQTKQQPTSLKEFGWKISAKFAQEVQELGVEPTLAVQPGRSISSEMGIAVAKVKVVKGDWVFLDISTSSLPESIFFAQREIVLAAEDARQRPIKKYSIAGCGLNTVDNFALNMKMRELKTGDVVVILDAGAYSISRANRFTILNPPVYLIQPNGSIKKIRRGETYGDVLTPMQPAL